MPVSVNISGRHLQHASLLEPVEAALRGVRLDAQPAGTRAHRGRADARLRHDASAARRR
ncbi:MAG: hypothetical protein MZV64_48665 [Ignavibacteriales bacterium]|nr:hypothetical protein [Ignavibacteriales bacterium]